MLGAVVLAVHGVGAHQPQVDVTPPGGEAQVVAERVVQPAQRGDEAGERGEVVDQVAGVQRLGELAPVGQPGLGDLRGRQHVHARGPYSRTGSGERV
nr:hypothetical protein [Angustibacter aerolatus]